MPGTYTYLYGNEHVVQEDAGKNKYYLGDALGSGSHMIEDDSANEALLVSLKGNIA
jgi:hypothetical protein